MLALEVIGPKHNEQVTKAWAVQKVVHKIMVFLQTHGIGSARTVRFHETSGEQTLELIRENPYRLALNIHSIEP